MDPIQMMVNLVEQHLRELLEENEIDYLGPRYWRLVLLAVRHLMECRDTINDKDELMRQFYMAKKNLLSKRGDSMYDDILVELEEILIGAYPMHNFWTTNYDVFCSHRAFKAHLGS